MIVVDLETSGLDVSKNGIVSIGALEFEKPSNIFYGECRIDDEEEVREEACKINGLSEGQMRDKNKQSQKELIQKFYDWLKECKIKILAGENIGWDVTFLQTKAWKYGISIPHGQRVIDLHTLSLFKYLQIKTEIPLHEGKSAMGLSKTLEFVGLRDERKAHTALEDIKLEAECFSRLLYAKPLFKEFENFPIPDYLKK